MQNKILSCKTNHDYQKRENMLACVEQMMTTKYETKKLAFMEQIATTEGTKT
jgi:hypothetical protein